MYVVSMNIIALIYLSKVSSHGQGLGPPTNLDMVQSKKCKTLVLVEQTILLNNEFKDVVFSNYGCTCDTIYIMMMQGVSNTI